MERTVQTLPSSVSFHILSTDTPHYQFSTVFLASSRERRADFLFPRAKGKGDRLGAGNPSHGQICKSVSSIFTSPPQPTALSDDSVVVPSLRRGKRRHMTNGISQYYTVRQLQYSWHDSPWGKLSFTAIRIRMNVENGKENDYMKKLQDKCWMKE